jgi:peptide/nickel transport system ATP-binding protein
MFQASQNAFNPVIKIKEHFIDTVKSHSNLKNKEILKRSKELLHLVNLDPERVLNSYPHELSGGMKQRILLAMCFLLNPEIIIMDEPTTALDVLTQRNVINSIKKLKDDFGFALGIITHDLATAAELVDTVATMYAGKIVEKGPVDEIYYSPLHPYTLGLIKAVPTVTTDFKELSSIPGTPPDLINLDNGCSFAPRCPISQEKCFHKVPEITKVNSEHIVACFNYKKLRDNSGDIYV